MEIETIKKSQREITLEIKNLGKRSGAIDASITNRIQETEERIFGEEDTIQKAYRTPNKNLNQKRNFSHHIIVKTPNAQNKERILNSVTEKGHVTYKSRAIRITPDFSPETMKARRSWADVRQTLRKHKCQRRLL